ncbi:uncharacterized protein LOC134210790 [Armigeres subalbatus]|uniref:uncharacterized protein LOC134210790 n=1 Tax=Armigeres subalbatus TaxID=124917 RepID=UPI002ED39EA8
MADNITVSIKVRPLIKREKESKQSSHWRIRGNTISPVEGNGDPFVFDHIFDETVPTRELFEKVCRPIILSTLNGINGTIFAYGQTSSGKTYTMMGEGQEPGVVPLAAGEIFKEMENIKDRQFLIRVGFIEIYNEKVFDLLDKSNCMLKIFETQYGDVSLNYKEFITNCPEQIMQYLEEGNKMRKIGDTNMNERSSRSHTIFRITIESRLIDRKEGDENDAVQSSTLNLVDLAGSERANQTGTSGSRFIEGAHINKSLLSLSCVIQKLSENAESADNLKYINYRDSKLTRILQASLGGNAVTTMICNITPAALDESYYTLSFAMRAKTIKNKPKVNEVLSDSVMMKRLEREIKRLQEQLKSEQNKNSNIKTLQLQNEITMRANQIINSQNYIKFDKSRRRTWCPSATSSISKPIVYVEPSQADSHLMPPPPPFLARPSSYSGNQTNSSIESSAERSPTLRPELANCDSNPEWLARKVRSVTPRGGRIMSMGALSNSDEFIPGELADFDERSPESLAREIHTPGTLKAKRRSRRSSTGETPTNFIDYEKRCRELEEELQELQEFTNLEKNLDLADIKRKLQTGADNRAEQRYKEERDSLEERCKDLTEDLLQKQEQIFDMEKELIVSRKEREAAVKEAENCRNVQNSVQMEYELYQQRAKSRENELVESLHEARGSSTPKADVQKLLDTTRQELKQLEVHNYELQRQLERQAEDLEKLKKAETDQEEKLSKMMDALNKDINRKDAKKLFRLVTKLRAILADEDLLLINTSIDTDEFADSLGDSSFNSDSLDRMSPSKIVLTNDTGSTNVIYKNGNSQMLDMTIENGELKKKVKLLEEESRNMDELLKKYEMEIEKLNKNDSQAKELAKQLAAEKDNSKRVNESFQIKKIELDKLTAEYDELSMQVMDNLQDIDNYKQQIEHLDKKLSESSATIDQLNEKLEAFKNTETDLQLLQEKNKATEVQLGEAHMRIVKLQEENENLLPFKTKFEESNQQIARLQSVSEQLEQLRSEYQELKSKNQAIEEAKKELEVKLHSMQESQEKHGELKTHFEEQQLKLKQLQEENHDLTVAVQELSAKLVSLEEQIVREDSSEQLDADEPANESIKTKLETSLELIKEETIHLSEALPNLEEIERKVQELEQEKELLVKQINDLQTNRDELQKTCVALQTDKENAVRVLKKDLDELNERYCSIQNDKLKQEEEIQVLTDSLSGLEESKSKLLHQIESLKEDHVRKAKESDHTSELEISLQKSLEELATFKEENIILVQQIENHKTEQQSIEDKCESLCNELSQMITVKDQTNEAEKQALQNKINDLQGINIQFQEKNARLSEQVSALQSELNSVGEQKSKLFSKLQAVENEMEESSNIRELLDREVRALKTDLNNLQQQLTENNEKLEQLQKENEGFRHELKSKTDQILHLEEQLTEARTESADRVGRSENEWCEKLKKADICNTEQKLKLDALETEKKDLFEQIDAVRRDRESLEKLVSEKNAELESFGHQIAVLETRLAEKELKNGECEKRRVEVENLYNVLAQEVEQLKQEVEMKEDEVITLQGRIAKAQEINETQQVLVQKEWGEKYKNIEASNEEQRQKSNALEMEKGLLEAQLKEIAIEQESLHEAIRTKDNQLEQIRGLITSLENQLKDMKLEKDRSEKEIAVFKEEHKTEKEHSNELQVQNDELKRMKDALESNMQIAQQQYDAISRSQSDLLHDKAQLDKAIIQLEAQVVNLKAELVIRDDKLGNLSQLVLENDSEIRQLNNRIKLESIEYTKRIEEQKSDNNKLKIDLENEKAKVSDYSNNQIPSLMSTIQGFTERQDELEKQLIAIRKDSSKHAADVERLDKLYQQEKLNVARLERALEEANQRSSPLQPDGRPSLGDGKVAHALRKENEDLLKQLNEMQKVHVFKTKQLQDRIDELKHMEVECTNLREELSTMRHESSFQEKETQIVELKEKINRYEVVYEDTNNRHRSLQRQNDELRMKHQNLVMEMDDLRRIADKDRKSRRQSSHDYRRGGLFDTCDKEIMTDPSSEDCSCREMDAQIKEMRKQLMIKECQLNTQKMMPNPLKNENVELRQLVRERESQINKLQSEIGRVSLSLDQELKRTDRRCNVCAKQQRLKSLRSDKAVGTERCDSPDDYSARSPLPQEQTKKLEEYQEELTKLKEKYQSMKRLCRIRNEKIASLNENIVEKENESCNVNKSVQQEVSVLKRQLKESEDKFSQIQKLYQSKSGSARLVERTVQTDGMSLNDQEILRMKYEKYKTMAITLMEQNEELKQRLSSAA